MYAFVAMYANTVISGSQCIKYMCVITTINICDAAKRVGRDIRSRRAYFSDGSQKTNIECLNVSHTLVIGFLIQKGFPLNRAVREN